MLGTTKQVISRYETNQRTPKITVAVEYSKKLNIPLDYLIDDSIDQTEYTIKNKAANAIGKINTSLEYNDQLIEDRLKKYILDRYGDMKTFSSKSGIPNSTLSSMFQRGIFNSTIGRVIQLTSALDISIDELVDGKITPKSLIMQNAAESSAISYDLIRIYQTLNQEGKDFLLKQARLISQSDEYTQKALMCINDNIEQYSKEYIIKREIYIPDEERQKQLAQFLKDRREGKTRFTSYAAYGGNGVGGKATTKEDSDALADAVKKIKAARQHKNTGEDES